MAEGIGELLAQNPMVMQAPEPTMEMPKLQENKSLWKSFMDKAQSDPNIRMALMSMGAGMLKSPGFGQNVGDVLGSSIAQGMGTFVQGRQMDSQTALAQAEQTRKQKETDTGAAVAQQNASTYATGVQQQGAAAQANIEQGKTQTAIAQAKANLEAELSPREVKVKERNAASAETSAQADLIRSKAYAQNLPTTGKSTGQNVQLVNQRKAALMAINPGMTDDEATLQAQNDILMSKQSGGNPATIAKGLFDTQAKLWQNNLDNLGKAPTPQDIQSWTDTAKKTALEWAKMNRQGTPTTGTSGTINRTGTEPSPALPEQEDLTGKKVQGTNGIGEILGSDGTNVRLRLPDGREITTTLEKVFPHIIAE